MTDRIFKKDFVIKSRRTGSQLRGRENQVEYVIWTADGKRRVKDGFYRKADADKWLSKKIAEANKILRTAEILKKEEA